MLIRDPVHGDIELPAGAARVLDLPDVQRLRGVKQLGTASYVYPGAVHTRFDHSLGACALARRIIASLRATGTPVSGDLEDLVTSGALLHDVTHIPFGHTLEDERRLFPRHDKGTRLATMLAGRLGDGLARLGLHEAVAGFFGTIHDSTVPPWARQIVSSTIDADLLDYLRRDAYFAGLATSYDDRIFRCFVVDDGQLAISMTKHGMERPDVRSETVQLLRARYFLTERVYYHHTKVAAGAMVSKAVELAQEHGACDEATLLRLGDAQLFEVLRRVPRETAPDPRLVGLVNRLERRDLLKRGYVLSAHSVGHAERRDLVQHYHDTPANRRRAEHDLAQALGCDPADVIVYCPALTVMKEAAALVRIPTGLARLNDAAHTDPEIAALETRYAELWRFYVFVPAAAATRTAAAAAALFGYPSEHHAAEA